MENNELKRIVRNRKLKPSDLFDKYDLQNDEAIKKMVKDEAEMKVYFETQELNKRMEKEIEEAKLKSDENDLIPGFEEAEKKKKSDDNDMIPGLDDEDLDKGDNEDSLIPD